MNAEFVQQMPCKGVDEANLQVLGQASSVQMHSCSHEESRLGFPDTLAFTFTYLVLKLAMPQPLNSKGGG